MLRTPATSSGEVGAGPAAAADGPPTGLALARLVEGTEAQAYASLFAAAQAARPELGFSTHATGLAVVLRAAKVTDSLLVNRVLGLGLDGPARPADITTLVSAFDGGRVPFGVELSPFAAPAELPQMLKAQRLRKSVSAQVLYRPGTPPPPHYARWAQATGLRVQSMGPEHAATLARICCQNFQVSDTVGELLRMGVCSPGWRRWLALDGDTPVGASLSYVQDGAAWLGWTSVLASHRGRWVHAGIVARQLEDANQSGCNWVTTETGVSTKEKPDAAYTNLRNFGFQNAYVRPIHVYMPQRPTA